MDIKALDEGSVHQICSGQVIFSLAMAVKELVENSLDAGATLIEIHLKEYGSDMIEVVDNGSGVNESNLEGLALKHHTSKITSFGDLTIVETLGFRGEALSSLCALSKMTVTTRSASMSVGSRIEYDHSGKIKNRTPCARQKGTTVTLQQLFSTLAVRQKEFLKNIKREYNKMLNLLYSYCIIATHVKFKCTNQKRNGNQLQAISTNGTGSLRDIIRDIFGQKQLKSLLDFVQHIPSSEICEEFGIHAENVPKALFKITGCISICKHGEGRNSIDRHFFYINKRPCDLNKVSKLINDVYHLYNRHQYPFVVLNISLKKDGVDINVTPDKRQIFLQDEKCLMAIIKTSLIRMYSASSSQNDVTTIIADNKEKISGQNLDSGSFQIENHEYKHKKINQCFSKVEVKHGNVNVFKRHDISKSQLEIFDQKKSNSDNLKNFKCIFKEHSNKTKRKKREFYSYSKVVKAKEKERIIPFSWKSLEKYLKSADETSLQSFSTLQHLFHAKISQSENQLAEKELQRQISKDKFSLMEVLGQFNLGFIIVNLDEDLFVIDQHASDEKYNFEMLQKTISLKSQKLISPQTMELTVANENIIRENLEIFRKNGFDFLFDESAIPTERVKIVSTPISKNWTFGKRDVEELIFQLSDAPGTLCHPSRVQEMFASRACRKSVMIGTALNYQQMKRVVNNMGLIDNPWNCPHGRPTMRHLFNLQLIPDY